MAGQPFGCRVNDWSRLVWRFPGFSTERLAFRGPPPFLANWHGWSLNLWDLISGCISTLTLFHLLLYSVLHPYQITCPKTGHSLSHLPAFAHASLCLPSAGLSFRCVVTLSTEPSPCVLVSTVVPRTTLIYRIFVVFSACLFITWRTNRRRKTADTMWVSMAKKEHKGK